MVDLPKQEIIDLLNRITQSDDQAVKRIYLYYQRCLFAFIRHLVPDDAAAEEILHDVFMVMCRKPESFDESSKFSTKFVHRRALASHLGRMLRCKGSTYGSTYFWIYTLQ